MGEFISLLRTLVDLPPDASEREALTLELGDKEVSVCATMVEARTLVEAERALSHLLLRSSGEQLALLVAPEITEEIEEGLARFVRAYTPDRAWGFVDNQGNAYVLFPDLGIDERQRVEPKPSLLPHTRSVRRIAPTARNTSLFTDLNAWLLKVMILNRSPEEVWDKPRHDIRGPVDLSREPWIAVSQGKAYQFAHTLDEMGFVTWRRGTFELVDLERLLRAWLDGSRAQRPHRVPVRSPFGDPIEHIFAAATTDHRYAYAGSLAAQRYDMRHTSGEQAEVYVWGDIHDILDDLLLEVCDPSQAIMYLVEPVHREAIARGIQRRGDVWVVDLIQTALDAARHRARGGEQVDFVIEEVLRWFHR